MQATSQWGGGRAALAMLAVGLTGLGALLPAYDPVRQTVSEIGEIGSAMQVPFSVLLLLLACCIGWFGITLHGFARRRGLSRWPVFLAAFMAIPLVGLSLYPLPMAPHGVFGLLEIVSYMAPVSLALAWRGQPGMSAVNTVSWVLGTLVLLVLFANLFAVLRPPAIWEAMRPVYGVVQRALFFSWFFWVAAVDYLASRVDAMEPALDGI